MPRSSLGLLGLRLLLTVAGEVALRPLTIEVHDPTRTDAVRVGGFPRVGERSVVGEDEWLSIARRMDLFHAARLSLVFVEHEIASLAEIPGDIGCERRDRDPEDIASQGARALQIVAGREQTERRQAERRLATDAPLGDHAAVRSARGDVAKAALGVRLAAGAVGGFVEQALAHVIGRWNI